MKYLHINLFDKFGIYLLYLAVSLVPFHFNLASLPGIAFYRELIAFLFIGLIIQKLYENGILSFSARSEVIFLIIFPILVSVSAIYDPLIDLYQSDIYLNTITTSVEGDIDPRIYIIRNALLYLPLVLYFSLRGISRIEISNLSLFVTIVAPFSILFYLLFAYESGNFSIFLLGEMAEYGGANISYNSYVPYLTFPFLGAIYLLFTKNNLVIKAICMGSISIMSIFMFLSSSRQSMLFLVIASLFYFLLDDMTKFKKILSLFILSFFILGTYFFLTIDVQLNQNLIDKYSTGAETSRFKILVDGFQLLRFNELISGAGLSSVVISGPHNDYLRWTQRVGVIFMIISFLPFFIAFLKSFKRTIVGENKKEYTLLTLLIFFTIYHSVFGYPREDAYQAIFCFTGLALWLGYSKNNLVRN